VTVALQVYSIMNSSFTISSKESCFLRVFFWLDCVGNSDLYVVYVHLSSVLTSFLVTYQGICTSPNETALCTSTWGGYARHRVFRSFKPRTLSGRQISSDHWI